MYKIFKLTNVMHRTGEEGELACEFRKVAMQ